MRDGCYKNEELGAGNAEMRNGNKTYLEQLEPILSIYLFIYLFIYLIAFTMITVLKTTREKNTFEQDTKTKDEGAGHSTERGFKLSVPSRKKTVVCL